MAHDLSKNTFTLSVYAQPSPVRSVVEGEGSVVGSEVGVALGKLGSAVSVCVRMSVCMCMCMCVCVCVCVCVCLVRVKKRKK